MNTKNDGAGDDQDDDDVGIGGTDDDDGEVSQNIARGVFSKHCERLFLITSRETLPRRCLTSARPQAPPLPEA